MAQALHYYLLLVSFSFICWSQSSQGVGSYQHVIVSGLPYDRGLSHGTQVKEKIQQQINHYKTSSSMPPWEDCLKFVKENYLDAIKYYYPNGLEEMRGIADGAGVTLDEILILNARYDLSRLKRSMTIRKGSRGQSSKDRKECQAESNNQDEPSDLEECTGGVALSSATEHGQVILGKNWDTSVNILRNDTAILLEVHPDPCEQIKPFVTLTEAGQLGRDGMNADGLGILGMALWSTADTFERDRSENSTQIGWVPATLLRRMFLESPSFPMGLRRILRTPVHVSNNMLIATGDDEALNIELVPGAYFVTRVPISKEILTHSNHFKSDGFLSNGVIKEGSRGGSSLYRDRRVEKQLLQDWPNITEATFEKAFSDQVGTPNAVCEIPVTGENAWTSTSPTDATVASLIFNLGRKTLQLAKGPPCQGNAYRKYSFNFSHV